MYVCICILCMHILCSFLLVLQYGRTTLLSTMSLNNKSIKLYRAQRYHKTNRKMCNSACQTDQQPVSNYCPGDTKPTYLFMFKYTGKLTWTYAIRFSPFIMLTIAGRPDVPMPALYPFHQRERDTLKETVLMSVKICVHCW